MMESKGRSAPPQDGYLTFDITSLKLKPGCVSRQVKKENSERMILRHRKSKNPQKNALKHQTLPATPRECLLQVNCVVDLVIEPCQRGNIRAPDMSATRAHHKAIFQVFGDDKIREASLKLSEPFQIPVRELIATVQTYTGWKDIASQMSLVRLQISFSSSNDWDKISELMLLEIARPKDQVAVLYSEHMLKDALQDQQLRLKVKTRYNQGKSITWGPTTDYELDAQIALKYDRPRPNGMRALQSPELNPIPLQQEKQVEVETKDVVKMDNSGTSQFRVTYHFAMNHTPTEVQEITYRALTCFLCKGTVFPTPADLETHISSSHCNLTVERENKENVLTLNGFEEIVFQVGRRRLGHQKNTSAKPASVSKTQDINTSVICKNTMRHDPDRSSKDKSGLSTTGTEETANNLVQEGVQPMAWTRSGLRSTSIRNGAPKRKLHSAVEHGQGPPKRQKSVSTADIASEGTKRPKLDDIRKQRERSFAGSQQRKETLSAPPASHSARTDIANTSPIPNTDQTGGHGGIQSLNSSNSSASKNVRASATPSQAEPITLNDNTSPSLQAPSNSFPSPDRQKSDQEACGHSANLQEGIGGALRLDKGNLRKLFEELSVKLRHVPSNLLLTVKKSDDVRIAASTRELYEGWAARFSWNELPEKDVQNALKDLISMTDAPIRHQSFLFSKANPSAARNGNEHLPKLAVDSVGGLSKHEGAKPGISAITPPTSANEAECPKPLEKVAKVGEESKRNTAGDSPAIDEDKSQERHSKSKDLENTGLTSLPSQDQEKTKIPNTNLHGTRELKSDKESSSLKKPRFSDDTISASAQPKRRRMPVPRTSKDNTVFRTYSQRPIQVGEILSDSEDEPDTEWIVQKHRDTVNAMSSLTSEEKEIALLYNEHFHSERLLQDKDFPGALLRFAERYSARLGASELLTREFARTLAYERGEGLITDPDILACMSAVQNFKGASKPQEPMIRSNSPQNMDYDQCGLCGRVVYNLRNNLAMCTIPVTLKHDYLAFVTILHCHTPRYHKECLAKSEPKAAVYVPGKDWMCPGCVKFQTQSTQQECQNTNLAPTQDHAQVSGSAS